MCGIFLGEESPDEETARLIANRGPDMQSTMLRNGMVAVSSVLAIRDAVMQPVAGEHFLFLYNGEIYNSEASDTLFIRQILEQSTDIAEIHRRINEHENEMALVVMTSDCVYFFKDDVGRRSLGYSLHPFSVSSVRYTHEIDPMSFYAYSLKTREVHSWTKSSSLVEAYLSRMPLIRRYLNEEKYVQRYGFLNRHEEGASAIARPAVSNPVEQLERTLLCSLRKRLHPGTICLFFSGGVDSMLLAVLLHHTASPQQRICLINTAFGHSFDRAAGSRCFEELCTRYPERTFEFIPNDVSSEELAAAREHVYSLIHPKTGPMDFNIGATLFFSARESRRYSKIAYLGSGADELFGGYRKYNADGFRANMLFDLFTISSHNLCRDDRIVSDCHVECRFPFLDTSVILLSLQMEDSLMRAGEENKVAIRELLRRHGFERASTVPKKAMQYGSGVSRLECTQK